MILIFNQETNPQQILKLSATSASKEEKRYEMTTTTTMTVTKTTVVTMMTVAVLLSALGPCARATGFAGAPQSAQCRQSLVDAPPAVGNFQIGGTQYVDPQR